MHRREERCSSLGCRFGWSVHIHVRRGVPIWDVGLAGLCTNLMATVPVWDVGLAGLCTYM